MTIKSAGIIVYRTTSGKLEVFIVHLGGPFWAKKDYGAWSFPKGLCEADEQPFDAALREFQEETGQSILNSIQGQFLELTPHKMPNGKLVYAWAVEGEIDETNVRSNMFEMEWPPKSGKMQQFPEVDRGAWFDIDEAKMRVSKGLVPFFEELEKKTGF